MNKQRNEVNDGITIVEKYSGIPLGKVLYKNVGDFLEEIQDVYGIHVPKFKEDKEPFESWVLNDFQVWLEYRELHTLKIARDTITQELDWIFEYITEVFLAATPMEWYDKYVNGRARSFPLPNYMYIPQNYKGVGK